MDTPSHTLFAEGYLLTRSTMRWFHEQYLSGPADKADWRASPLKADSLADLPPAYVVTAGSDPLRAEGDAHARRLIDAPAPVTIPRDTAKIHGFLTTVRSIAQSAVEPHATARARRAVVCAPLTPPSTAPALPAH